MLMLLILIRLWTKFDYGFPPPAHDVGLDGPGPGDSQDCPSPGQRRAAGDGGKTAEWVRGRVIRTGRRNYYGHNKVVFTKTIGGEAF
jgi:hypothetical protein